MERPQDRTDPEAGRAATGELAGKRALVVGGSGGIGAELSVALARRGAELLVHGGGSEEGLARTLARAAEASEGGQGRPRGFLLKIGSPGDLLGRLADESPFDIVALAFGPFLQAPLHETKPGDWERLALLDLALPGALASACLPSMMKSGYGRFLFFGGTRTDAIRAYASNAAYAAAKTGLGVLVKSIAAEYAGDNIAAFLLCPGFVGTEYQAPAALASLAGRSPRGRLLDPAAVAEFGASLLASEDAIASGAIINLDGGLKL